MKRQNTLYHGTCRAFLAYALENKGMFGPENGELSFTPEINHAVLFSEQWGRKYGVKNLENYFGEIDDHLREPIILEIEQKDLDFKYRKDCGADEYFLKSSLDLSKVKRIYFKEGIEELLKGRKN
jgi:hypothetical protein